jgi:hypothetical protein
MTINEIGMATIARLRVQALRPSPPGARQLLPIGAGFAMAVLIVFLGAGVGQAAGIQTVSTTAHERTEGEKFANSYGYGDTDSTVAANERTEGERFANNYGYGNVDHDPLAGRTPQELSTHKALARLARSHEIAVASERTEGERFANNYGFGTPSQAVASVERTEGERFANNYGFGTPSQVAVANERTEGEKFANSYGYGNPGAGFAGDDSRVASANSSPATLPDSGLSLETMAITASLTILLMGFVIVMIRRRNWDSAV